MKKILTTFFVVAMTCMLAACGGNSVEDEAAEKYIAEAKEVVTLLNEGNYEEIHTKFDDEMKAGLPVTAMEELTPILEGSGSFQEIDKESVEEQDGYYVTVLAANYSEENRVFTITFNEADEIAGLHIK